jgi:tetratricopeptide (TPR) repeat protein
MKMRHFLLVAALISSLFLLYGCGDNGGGGGQTAEELVNQGWAKFDAGDNTGASADFKAALGLNAEVEGAYLGLGWAELRQSHAGMAEKAFLNYLSKVSDSNDAKAGLALAYHAQDKFEDAIDMAEAVLDADQDWSLSPHAPEINYLDLALVLAESYYSIGEFSQSLLVVQQYFDISFDPDVTTDTGRDQLAAKLESLYTG